LRGSVRGIIANYFKHEYTGIDLSKKQIESNYEQAKFIVPDNIPNWIVGDSEKELYNIQDDFDFIFSCPPYMNLEIYSDHVDDLSNMTIENFTKKYDNIISSSCKLLKENRFACFVVGDIRDKKGFYIGLPELTKNIFIKNGLKLYNEIILLNEVGSAQVRINTFMRTRKMIKIHQNILIFYKGDTRKITEIFKLDDIRTDIDRSFF